MKNSERLELIRKIKDAILIVYDALRISERKGYNEEIKEAALKTAEINELFDLLINDYIICSYPIIAIEDTIIETEETVEIKTGISDLLMNDNDMEFVFFESISSCGHLTVFQKSVNNKIKIFAKNERTKKDNMQCSVSNNDYYDPTITRCFEPGNYQIKKNTVIGMYIKKGKKLTHDDNHKRLSFSN